MTYEQTTLSDSSKDPKISRHQSTGYATVEILGREIVLKKGTSLEEAFDKPAQEVVECAY
jgi:hypothetical protein